MRLHLIISRHGLPATRILWTTSTAASLGEYGTRGAAPTSAIASSRNPNVAFSNGGYTIAQLLEDVNEVVPLETEPNVFDPEFSGQWGLEDYVVEVGGSECLHFMEVEGLLREGDEVVYVGLALPSLWLRLFTDNVFTVFVLYNSQIYAQGACAVVSRLLQMESISLTVSHLEPRSFSVPPIVVPP